MSAHNPKAEDADFGQAVIDAVRARIKREALDRFTSDYLAEDAREWLAGFAARAAISEIGDRLEDLRHQLEAAKETNTAVWSAAIRASRRGDQLDPSNVLDLFKETR